MEEGKNGVGKHGSETGCEVGRVRKVAEVVNRKRAHRDGHSHLTVLVVLGLKMIRSVVCDQNKEMEKGKMGEKR